MADAEHDTQRWRSLLAGVRIRSVVPLGAGLDHRAFEVNDELVIRQATSRGAGTADRTRREVGVLRLAARRSTLAVPEVIGVDAATGVIVLRKVRGVPLLDRPAADPMRHADVLAAFLERLHATPLSSVEGIVPRDDHAPADLMIEAARHYGRAIGAIPHPCRATVEDFLTSTPPPPGAAVALCHNDLGAEHLLIDETGTLHGVIDWTDAARADPAADLGRLLRDLGPEVVARVLDLLAYGDEDILARARFRARCALLEDLVHGLETGDTRYSRAALGRLPALFGDASPS